MSGRSLPHTDTPHYRTADTITRRIPFSLLFILAIVLLLAMAGPASAKTRTWNGATSNAWLPNANWNPADNPDNNDDIILTGAGSYRPENQNRGAINFKSLTFDATTATAFTLSGSPITFTTGGAGTDLTIRSGAAGHTIACNIAMMNTQIWDQGSSNPFTVSGVISGSSTLTKRGTGTLIFTGTDTYTGTTTVSAGTLQLGDGAKTGNIIPAANLLTNNAALIYTTPSTITHSGVISGTGTLTKAGSGTLILSGANAYTGATTVSAGELRFNGINKGSSVKTVSGGTLAGTGTIPGAVTIQNTAESKLRGGTGSGTAGTLTINGGLTFSGLSSALDVTSDGAALSRVSVGTNTITESSGMTVNLLDPMPAGTFTLISKTSGVLPATVPTLGTNNSGRTAVFSWVPGTGLVVTLIPPPVFVSAITTTDGGLIVITFDKAMDGPGGRQSQFTYSINGGPAQPFSAAALNATTTMIDLTPSGTAIAYGDTVTVSYTRGTITSADGGILATFTSNPVTNTRPAPTVGITLNENSITLPLDPLSSPATDAGLKITVSAGAPFIITVADNSGRAANKGYMGSYTGAAYDASPSLASPLQLTGTTSGTTTAQLIIPPITTAQTLYTGSAPVTSQVLSPNTFTQPVSFSDPHLTGGSTYRIDLLFTIAAT